VDTAREVCARLGLEHIVVDYRNRFEESVVGPFVRAYADGLTPNPCTWCNRWIKAGELVDYALESGYDFLATGHYARLRDSNDHRALVRGVDPARDQSYFLYAVDRRSLERLMFPLGNRHKVDVKREALATGLLKKLHKETREACFVPREGYRTLLEEREALGAPAS
jgi:tRNA-specific 2-thiouridylase